MDDKPEIIKSTTAEYIPPTQDVTVKDYEEGLKNLETIKEQIGLKLVDLSRECEVWKRDSELVWVEKAKPKRGTVYLSPDAQEFNHWVLQAENSQGETRTLIVYNPGDGLSISEYDSEEGANLPGVFVQTVLIKYPRDKIETTDDPEDFDTLGVGCAPSHSDPAYPGQEEFLYDSQPNLQHPFVFGWELQAVGDDDKRTYERRFVLKKPSFKEDVDVIARAEEMLSMLKSSRLVGKWDRNERTISDVKLSLPENSS